MPKTHDIKETSLVQQPVYHHRERSVVTVDISIFSCGHGGNSP
jgi:hypothetical protein